MCSASASARTNRSSSLPVAAALLVPLATALWQTPGMSAEGGDDQVFVLRATIRELVIYLAFLAVFSIGAVT